MFRFAQAANVISFSNTLSDSEPSAVANHTITFVTPSGVATGTQIVLTFASGFGGISSLNANDLDLLVNGANVNLATTSSGATWGVLTATTSIQITSGTGVIPANATVTIRIGTQATHQASGVNQIVNPSTAGSYEILVTAGQSDSGSTRVAIVPSVTVTAQVDTIFNFTVAGVASGVGVNGATTTVTSSSTAIAFGVLGVNAPAVGAHDLSVHTNAANGFVVTVQTDQQLTSANGAVIDGFFDGSYATTPTPWVPPSENTLDNRTWGHWGLTTNDDTFPFSSQFFVSASTTPVEIFRHTGPTAGSDQGIGITRVGYQVEITALQEAADDYTATLTYVATPVF